jgi:dynein heavy chain 1
MLMTWKKIDNKNLENDQMMIPVYLNRTRKNLILSLKVNCGKNKTTLYQKGISIIGWTI